MLLDDPSVPQTHQKEDKTMVHSQEEKNQNNLLQETLRNKIKYNHVSKNCHCTILFSSNHFCEISYLDMISGV